MKVSDLYRQQAKSINILTFPFLSPSLSLFLSSSYMMKKLSKAAESLNKQRQYMVCYQGEAINKRFYENIKRSSYEHSHWKTCHYLNYKRAFSESFD